MRLYALIRGARELLSGDSLLRQMTPAGIHEHRLPQAPGGMYVRLVIRQLQTAIDETAHGALTVPVQVMAECRDHPDPHLALEAVQERVEAVLKSQTITTDFGEVFVPIERARRGSVLYHDDTYTLTTQYTFISK